MAMGGLDPLVFGAEPLVTGTGRCWYCGSNGTHLTELGSVCNACLAPQNGGFDPREEGTES